MNTSIFYFTPHLPPSNNAPAIRNEWFIKKLKKQFPSVDVYTYTDTTEANKLYFDPPTNKESSISRLIKELISGIELFLRVVFTSKKLYIFSSPPFVTILIGSMACRLLGKNYVLDIRDIYPDVFYVKKLIKENSIAGKFINYLTKNFYNKAILIITTSVGQAENVIKYSSNDNIQVINNGYDPILFSPTKYNPNEFNIIFHGTLGKFQRVDLIKDIAHRVFERTDDIKFIIIGDGPGKSDLSGLPDNCEYLGAIPFNEIPKAINLAHLGISFRTDDIISKTAIPVKVFEYIGSEIPVILTPKGEAGEILIHHEIGFQFDNEQVSGIVDTIMKLYNSKDDYLYYKNNIKKISATFSRDKQSDDFLQLINKVFKNINLN